MPKPKILIARAIFPEIVELLAGHFDVECNPEDRLLAGDELIARLQGKQGVMTMGAERIDAGLLAACPDLRICANLFVGYNNFDVPAMTAAGVLATNVPDVLTETTADLGFSLLMSTARRITESERFVRSGAWQGWCYDQFAGQDIHGTVLGILGMGRIGQAIARRGALGFGMKVIYHNRSRLPDETEALCQARYVSQGELLRTADHLVLVLPYSPAVHHLIDAEALSQMKPTATLINIARGGIVDDAALACALREKRLAAAGLDVYENEPQLHPDLLAVPNIVLTPHIGSATLRTRLAMARLAADNLIGYLLENRPVTPLNPEVIRR